MSLGFEIEYFVAGAHRAYGVELRLDELAGIADERGKNPRIQEEIAR